MTPDPLAIRFQPTIAPADGRVLLIENSRAYAALLAAELREQLGIGVVIAASLREAQQRLAEDDDYFLALTGLVLPDAGAELITDTLARAGIPMVVATGVYDEAIRSSMADLPIIDYVLKEAPGTIDYLVWLVRRLHRNRTITAMVVDHSLSARARIAAQLKLYGFRVIQADDAATGLLALEEDPAIRLVILDQDLEAEGDAGGIGFIRQARRTHPRGILSIIGTSSSADPSSVARFLKNGANDFLEKPFSREEFFCRISQNIDNLELIGTLQDLATKDYLTGLPNRRHFLDRAERMLREDTGAVAMAMLDVDHFKHVNDTHGHEAGDEALRAVAATIAAHAGPNDVAARFGGEEFCLLAPGLSAEEAETSFERLREAIGALRIPLRNHTLQLTISIGVCHRGDGDLHALVTEADRLLYLAKARGRDRVVCESQEAVA